MPRRQAANHIGAFLNRYKRNEHKFIEFWHGIRIAMQDSRLRRPTDTLIFNIREIEIEMTDRGKWKWDRRCKGPEESLSSSRLSNFGKFAWTLA